MTSLVRVFTSVTLVFGGANDIASGGVTFGFVFLTGCALFVFRGSIGIVSECSASE
jgi:hypothetical protein